MKTKLNNEQQARGVGGVGGNAGFQMLDTKIPLAGRKPTPLGLHLVATSKLQVTSCNNRQPPN